MSSKTVVLSCAGVGSRLGMGINKCLLELNGRPLIHWHLDLFKDIDDIRVVVGYQAEKVIETVLQVKKDALFVFNQDYRSTQPAASLYLGAKFAQDYVIQYDGDLFVHPDDMRNLLSREGEWLAYADRSSEDPVSINLNDQGQVVSFSRGNGQFEWTGPCCLKRTSITPTLGHVYQLVTPRLPIMGVKVRAHDIDTVADYHRVLNIVSKWYQ